MIPQRPSSKARDNRIERPGLHGKKSARELRQRGSDYRCCIPALAGFVSPQSIAPDGMERFRETVARAITICRPLVIPSEVEESLAPRIIRDVSVRAGISLDITKLAEQPFDRCTFVCSYRVMQWLWLIFVFMICSCATPSNRRDLYRPERNYEAPLQTTTTSVTTKVRRTKTVTRPEPQGPITPDEEPVLPPP